LQDCRRGGLGLLKEILGRYESPEFKHFPAEFRDKAGYWGSTFQNTFYFPNKRNVKPDIAENLRRFIEADLERPPDHQRHG
jgi:hypothetical protein